MIVPGTLNESPSEKEGKSHPPARPAPHATSLNESPSEKEGKSVTEASVNAERFPSMKVPPKRKGNKNVPGANARYISLNESPSEKEGKFRERGRRPSPAIPLNESPSEKEGKLAPPDLSHLLHSPSMKVPPKRKGNFIICAWSNSFGTPLNESPSEKEGK